MGKILLEKKKEITDMHSLKYILPTYLPNLNEQGF